MPYIYESDVIRKRLIKLRHCMKRFGVDCTLITGNDYHNSEYAGEYFKTREYFSGFTGSAGLLLVTPDSAYLYTDGRYFIQAQLQLEGTGIKLMKQGIDISVDKLIEKMAEERAHGANAGCNDKFVLGFDARTVSAAFGEKLKNLKNIIIKPDFDPAKEIWTNRLEFPENEIYELSEKYAGETRERKLIRVREVLKDKADLLLISSLDDIAWLLNLRGNDIKYCPVFMGYLLVYLEKADLFVKGSALSDEIKEDLINAGINIFEYDEFDLFLKGIKDQKVMLDKAGVNFYIYNSLSEASCSLVSETLPTTVMKAVKNDTEIKNLKEVNIYDGAAVAKCIFDVKRAFKEGKNLKESDVAAKVDDYRREIDDFKELSFETICAFADNAAQIHYSISRDTEIEIKAGDMILMDSGGHYLRGTTDITRTFSYGEPSDKAKELFTLVLKGMLSLQSAIFPSGTSGAELDILARGSLWKRFMDYRHGTGHGVGYMLNVHEGPNAFSRRAVGKEGRIAAGMVTTDEPGVYLEDELGIRIENDLLCVERTENEYGKFLSFEALTLCPIDLDLVVIDMLSDDEKKELNTYHKRVYRALEPVIGKEYENDLKYYTREV